MVVAWPQGQQWWVAMVPVEEVCHLLGAHDWSLETGLWDPLEVVCQALFQLTRQEHHMRELLSANQCNHAAQMTVVEIIVAFAR